MTKNERENLRQEAFYRCLLLRFKVGCEALRHDSVKRFVLLGYFALMLWMFWGMVDRVGTFAPLLSVVSGALFLLGFMVFTLLVIALLGTPWGATSVNNNLRRAGLVNHAGEVPLLLGRYKDKNNPNITILEFEAGGIPRSAWEAKTADIEAALNVHVAKIDEGSDKRRILLYTLRAENKLPDILMWRDEYLSPENFVLVLGESLLGPVTVNLAHTPHTLIGGSTGSGKSRLLKLLLMQALHKGAEVFIADFKGGVDFPKIWHYKCWMCFTEKDLLKMLTDLVNELERRKELFRATGCANIDEFNKTGGEYLKRWVFACDEVAEVLDKTGRSKEDKELLAQIENKLTIIARQGRAFGIHLILATQRPDTNVIPGQIKNNLDFRVCGRADNVLSQIILDSTDAADLIPKDARGRFLTGDGTVFQGYLFDEEQL